MTCQHLTTKTIRERGYSGPVSRDEHRAAHGCVTITEECLNCGARRDCNVNQHHVEEGPWGPTRAQRRAVADALARRASELPRPTAEVTSGDRRITVAIDDEGYLTFNGSPHTEADLPAIALASGLLEPALVVRAAVRVAEDAMAAV